jgi:hypothetical protein
MSLPSGANNKEDDLAFIEGVTGLKPRPAFMKAGVNTCRHTYAPDAPTLPYVDLTTTARYESGAQVLYCGGGEQATDSKSWPPEAPLVAWGKPI